MPIDLDRCEQHDLRRTRFCIVGAGIAGLVLAHRLAGAGFTVTLLEAGGLTPEDRSQQHFDAEMAEERHTGTHEGRFRTFGGSSTRWGAQLLPFTSDVFAPPAGFQSQSWPVGEEELAPYYPEIERLMQVGNLPFTDKLLPALGHPAVDLGSRLRLRFSKWAPFGRRNLADTTGRECLSHPLIQLVLHANVAGLQVHNRGVTRASLVDYHGRRFHLEADEFIVAAGTVESSRILLSSPELVAQANTHDQFGRYFHDHVSVRAALLPGMTRKHLLESLGPFFVQGVLHTCKLEATPALQREQQLLAVMAHVVVEEPADSGIAAVRNLLVSLQRGKFKRALTSNLLPMLRGMGDVLQLAWSVKVRKRRAVSRRAVVALHIDMEQPARAENRIRLSPSLDQLGLPKAIVDWRIGDTEYSTARRFATLLKGELELAGFHSLQWVPGLLEGDRSQTKLTDTYHAMGGLRMGVDPTESVVDGNLKLHGVDHLYVASCAVFPSGGSSNPTFTLMALTMRLGDHLAGLHPPG